MICASDPEDLDRLDDLLDVIAIELRRAGRRKRLGHESYVQQDSKENDRANSSPGPSPRSKWRSEKPLAKAAEILHESWTEYFVT